MCRGLILLLRTKTGAFKSDRLPQLWVNTLVHIRPWVGRFLRDSEHPDDTLKARQAFLLVWRVVLMGNAASTPLTCMVGCAPASMPNAILCCGQNSARDVQSNCRVQDVHARVGKQGPRGYTPLATLQHNVACRVANVGRHIRRGCRP